MDMQPPRVATIASDAEVDHAIATLVLAFGSDPVARWMYDDPHQYLLHIPRLFRALGRSSFGAAAAQRTDDGHGVALWLPPGVHGDDGPLEAVIAESMVGEKQVEVAAVFERTEYYRPTPTGDCLIKSSRKLIFHKVINVLDKHRWTATVLGLVSNSDRRTLASHGSQ